jgi:outer membrane translocation and assembly module TamA
LKQAGACNEKNAEEDKFLGVAHLFGKEEEESAGDKDNGKKVGAQPEEEKENTAEVGAGWSDEVGFWVLRRLGVK